MKKSFSFIFLILIAVLIAVILIIKLLDNSSPVGNQKACINNKCFEIELAKTPEERARGLMYREYLQENKGMLFIFTEEAIYPFWMKNTLIPLDIIWINSNEEIIYIASNVLPCKEQCSSINPNDNALYVLEVNANLSEKYNFNIGDKVEFKNQ